MDTLHPTLGRLQRLSSVAAKSPILPSSTPLYPAASTSRHHHSAGFLTCSPGCSPAHPPLTFQSARGHANWTIPHVLRLNPGSIISQLCDLGQVTELIRACDTSWTKGDNNMCAPFWAVL